MLRLQQVTAPTLGQEHVVMKKETPLGVARPPSAFLQQPYRLAAILGAFALFTIPLCLYAVLAPASFAHSKLPILYIWCLGTTHFVLTITVYFQSANLRYYS